MPTVLVDGAISGLLVAASLAGLVVAALFLALRSLWRLRALLEDR